jgi:HEAT repeat protein
MSDSTPRSRTTVIGTVVVLGLGLTFAGLARGRATAPTAVEAAPDARPRTQHAWRLGSAALDGRACALDPGARMAYEVVSKTDVDLDMAKLSSGIDVGGQGQVAASPPDHHVVHRSWRLELEVLRAEADGSSVLAARIDDGEMSVRGRPMPARTADDLARTFLIRVGADCSLREFGWRSDGDLDVAREQQVLVAGLSFTAPRDAREAQVYGGGGIDSTGRYLASYRYEDGRVVGEATAYALGEAGSTPVRVEILASTITVELGAGAWFESLENERDLALRLRGIEFGGHFRSTIADRVTPGRFTPEVDLDDGGWSWGRVPPAARDVSEEFDPSLRERPLDDLLARYRELVASDSSGRTLLRDWLRANPEQTSELLARLRAGEFADDRTRAGVFYALGAANTEAARGALVDVLSDWPSAGQQIAAAHALSMVQQPSPEMVELVAAATTNPDWHPIERRSMALALGAVAHGNGPAAEPVAAEARGQIQDWLETPGSDEQVSHGLLAAGNAGADELAPVIGAYIDHDSPEIRKQATRALRQVSPDEAFPQLEHALDDDDALVRGAALDSAASVARLHDHAPSEALVGRATDSLASDTTAERHAAIALLREAASRGDAGADAALRAHLRERLDGEVEPAELVALGRGAAPSWRAN